LKKLKIIYENLIKIKKRKSKPYTWDCAFCGDILRNFNGTSRIYWCPNCKVWHHNTLALLGKQSDNPFDNFKYRIQERRKPSESLTAINIRLNNFYIECQEKLRASVIIYSYEDYDQEYLRSLVPSLNRGVNNEYKD
jgi:hypothetical protein